MNEYSSPEALARLKERLTADVVTINFTKVDGSARTIRATLRADTVVPYVKKTERTRPENAAVLRVWDVDKGAWRGFRVDAITSVEG